MNTKKQDHKVLGVIPARLASTRFPEKMLAEIAGKPLVYYTWIQAKKAKELDDVVIATDSERVRDAAIAFGAKVVMSPNNLASGSDRVAYTASVYKDFVPDIVVNIQGDEPLLPPEAIDDTVKMLKNSGEDIVVTTPACPFNKEFDLESPQFVKVVVDKNNTALYFSRSRIPYPRSEYDGYLKHLGLYVYRADFLKTYTALKETSLEKAEKLEQLRIMENGHKIGVSVGSYFTCEVNTLEEFKIVKNIIESRK